jgi:tetratricopeptide (TPR) repeat protein/DNA-binding SARP family transcriptional activator
MLVMGGDRTDAGLVVALLGPVEVGPARGAMTPVTQPRLRVLLGLLGVAANHVVSVEALVDGVWGEEWSPRRDQNLHTLVYQLRRRLATLEPGGRARLVRAEAGYRLVLGPGDLDVAIFQNLARRGREAARAGDTAGARELFGRALGVWRGAALADATQLCPRLAGEAARLEEARLAVVEERIGCDLALGRHGEVAAELAGLVAAFPLRERLAALLMTALYRCGRRGEALAAYDTVRRVLAGQLGLDPGPELAGLQAQVLADDPALAATAGPGGAAAATRTLPRDLASFTGRQRELRELVAAAAGASGVVGIHAIGGMAGIGKTALAVHAAHQLAGRFPAGQIFLPLHGHTPGQQPVDPADALASLLLTAGVPAAQIPPGLEARMALWRDRLAERQLLLVLDDAASSEQVLPLLPGTGGSLVLVTSRRHLTALEDATAISLDTLPPGEAAELLVRLAARPGFSPADPAVGQITRLCGYLPLAIGMLARQLHHHSAWSAVGRAAELAAARDRLELMTTENLSVAAAFNLSYADLTVDQQRLFRRLGLHPGADVDAYDAAALDGSGLAAARRGLEALYDQYLLAEPAHGRYRMHDLIREHSRALAGRLDTDGDRDQATGRLLDYYQHAGARAEALLTRQARRPTPAQAAGPRPAVVPALTDREQALAWARAERTNLLACLDHATGTGQHARITALTAGLAGLLRHDGPWAEALTCHATALRAAQHLGDRPGQAGALTNLADVRHLTGDYPGAARDLQEAVSTFRDLGDRLGQANALTILGDVRGSTGDYPGAARDLQEALGIYRDLGDRLGQANALTGLGGVRRLTGDYPAAARDLQEALGIYRDLGGRPAQADALNILGYVRWRTGDYPGATRDLREALGICRDLGERRGQARALANLGRVRRLTGDYQQAAEDLEQALGLYRDLGDRRGQANALWELGAVRRQTGDYSAAARGLEEALDIYRDLGDRGGEAVALNETGTLHRVGGDLRKAGSCHQQALDLAWQIGSAWDEAHALAGLGRCARGVGHTAEAEDQLHQALDIFQRIGAAEAAEVSAELEALADTRPAAHGS